MHIVRKSVISGPHWSLVSAVGHNSPSSMSAADATTQYRHIYKYYIGPISDLSLSTATAAG